MEPQNVKKKEFEEANIEHLQFMMYMYVLNISIKDFPLKC